MLRPLSQSLPPVLSRPAAAELPLVSHFEFAFLHVVVAVFSVCGASGCFADDASVRSGDWLCSLCRDLVQPEVEYDCESARTPGGHTAATHGLAACDQRVSAHRDLSPFLHAHRDIEAEAAEVLILLVIIDYLLLICCEQISLATNNNIFFKFDILIDIAGVDIATSTPNIAILTLITIVTLLGYEFFQYIKTSIYR